MSYLYIVDRTVRFSVSDPVPLSAILYIVQKDKKLFHYLFICYLCILYMLRALGASSICIYLCYVYICVMYVFICMYLFVYYLLCILPTY